MDPTISLRNCDQAISDCELAEAYAYAAEYQAWRAGWGIEPLNVAGTTMSGDAFLDYCFRRLADLRDQILDDYDLTIL